MTYDFGGYPAGAEYDSNAPWNDARKFKTCGRCGGSGRIHIAENINTGELVEVNDITAMILPRSEEEASGFGQRYILFCDDICPECEGEGQIQIHD